MGRKKISQGVLNVTNSAELLSYIINVTPELRENIPLPTQGESINGIGKIIMNNINNSPPPKPTGNPINRL